MTIEEAIKWFGSRQALADALGVSLHVTYRWTRVIPLLRQYQIEEITNGEVKR